MLQLVGEWAQWNGFSRPAMSSVYSTLETGIWVLVVFLLLVSLLKLGLLLHGIICSRRHFAPLVSYKKNTRLLQVALSLLIIFFWWLVGEMVVANLLPVLYDRLGLALVFFAVTVLLAALFPPVTSYEAVFRGNNSPQ